MMDILAITGTVLIVFLIMSKYSTQYQHLAMQVEKVVGGYQMLHRMVGSILAISLAWLLRIYRKSKAEQILLFILILLCYALDEWLQSLVPHRHASLNDFKNSAVGWSAALLLWACLFWTGKGMDK
ncbi:hypothetical protein LZ24_02284 [Desulfobotulus alkaliphilus]|uniref:VanZ like protein n=2 Tax=Desulfobotulus alkaliphilus TaxID=622671 RepID=A0A562RQB1_9BACT|nr:hypothetical protein LZ24_02284 [Desulfobotulus alkaliphilus]